MAFSGNLHFFRNSPAGLNGPEHPAAERYKSLRHENQSVIARDEYTNIVTRSVPSLTDLQRHESTT